MAWLKKRRVEPEPVLALLEAPVRATECGRCGTFVHDRERLAVEGWWRLAMTPCRQGGPPPIHELLCAPCRAELAAWWGYAATDADIEDGVL